MLRKILLFIVLLLSICRVEAQINKNEFRRKTVDLKTKNIIEIVKDKDSSTISIFSDYYGIEKIKEGHFKGGDRDVFKEGVVFQNGSKVQFEDNESYLCSYMNYVYTIKEDLIKLEKTVRVYEIANHKLIKTNYSLTISNFYNSITKLSNSKFFIVSDFYESKGDSIKLYDNTLHLIRAYSFFRDGFGSMVFGTLNKSIFLITTPDYYNTNKGYKVTIINTDDNFSVKEVNYSDVIVPLEITSFNNYIALGCIGKILLFDKEGKHIWTKEINASSSMTSIIGSETDNKLFAIVEGAIGCFNFSDGGELWRIQLKDIYPKYEEPKSIQNEYYMSYSPMDLQLISNLKLVGFVSAKQEQFLNQGTIKHSEKNITLIDFNGNIVKNISLASNSLKSTSENDDNRRRSKVKPSHLIQIGNGFGVIENGKIETYEK